MTATPLFHPQPGYYIIEMHGAAEHVEQRSAGGLYLPGESSTPRWPQATVLRRPQPSNDPTVNEPVSAGTRVALFPGTEGIAIAAEPGRDIRLIEASEIAGIYSEAH